MTRAFKEWALICQALGSGSQSIIIRKGGIAEGRDGFTFKHKEFCLFPTWFHEQLEKTILPPDTRVPEQREGTLEIRFTACVEWSCVVKDREKLRQLREHHVWKDDVIEERFCYEEEPGVHVAFVRVFRLEPPVVFPMEKKYGGCRSWVDLPDLDSSALVSVLSEEEHERRKRILLALLAGN